MGQERGGRGDTESEPAVTRRVLLASVAGMTGLAGCSSGGDDGSNGDADGGGDGSGDNGGDSSSDDGSESSSNGGPSIESMCDVTDDVEGLSVVGCQSETQDGSLVATVTVTNDGDQETNLFNYRLQTRAYDSGEAAIENNVTGSVTVTYEGVPEIQPGETTVVTTTISPNPDVSADDIELYTVTLNCGFGADGVYCEGS